MYTSFSSPLLFFSSFLVFYCKIFCYLASWAFNLSAMVFFSLIMASICELLAVTEEVFELFAFSSLLISYSYILIRL